MRSIGAMARESGLTVSALRFYDGAGVFGPAHVDPHTGYRAYAPDQVVVARLVAALRRVGMPLAGIRAVLARRDDPAAVDALLAAHLRRLEQGVADARRVLSTVPALLASEESTVSTTVTVDHVALAAALASVRFAVGTDPGFPVLGGVLLDVTPTALTVVATDRYRLAVAAVPVSTLDGPPAAVVVPAELADRIATLDGGAPVELRVDGAVLTASAGAAPCTGRLLEGEYPDFRRLLPAGDGRAIEVDAAALRAAVDAGGTRRVEHAHGASDVTVLSVDTDGRLDVGATGEGTGVDAEFLLQALDAGGPGPMTLELDGPLLPVTLRPVARPDAFSLLMPVRL